MTQVSRAIVAVWLSMVLSVHGFCVDTPLRAGVPADTVYSNAWKMVLQEAGLDLELINLSSALRRGMFIRGEIQFDCCQAEKWRQRPREQAIQIFTDTLFYTVEHMVAHEEASTEKLTPEALINYRVAVVFDHTYIGSEFFGATMTVANTREALRAVANNEADIAITTEPGFTRFKLDEDLPLKLVGVFYRSQIKARVHKDQGQLVTGINAAIGRLKATNAIAQMIGKSIDQTMTSATLEEVPAGQADSEGFSLAWIAILQEAGINAQIIKAPHARKRRLFVKGLILVDCCVVPIWRSRPEEKVVQLFSDVFYEAKEYYIFPRGIEGKTISRGDLRSMTVAVIRGYDYHLSAFFGGSLAVSDVAAQMDLLEAGRVHVAIISGIDFRRQMFLKPRDLVMGGVNLTSGLRIRVHKSHAYLLPRINKAIANLQSSGKIKELIQQAQIRR